MSRATWLKPVLAAGGLELIELGGWETRGADRLTVNAVVRHHTATGTNWTDAAVANLLGLKGNATTPPPLSQLGLDRHGRYWLIAAGRCNHNGYGTYGNDAIGIEAFNNGLGEPWPEVQVDAYDLGVALILEHLGLPTERDLAHRETDPGRKTDPVGLDMDERRAAVRRIRYALNHPAPEEDTMAAYIIKGAGYATRFVDAPFCFPISSATEGALVKKGVPIFPFTKTEATKLVDQCGRALDDADVVAAIKAEDATP